MAQSLDRLLAKVKAKRGKSSPSDAILIICDKPEDVPGRVDVLIAAGKLTEADRPRCVFWEADSWDGTHEQWCLMLSINDTPQDYWRRMDEYAKQDAAELAAATQPAQTGKKRKAGSL
jgi:hypothetical protein